MSYEGSYPIVLKKLFLPYWILLVHIFLQCIVENKGRFDQMNKTKACALVALVNSWMFLDAKYPELVKGANHVNLKPMGPGCFENACKERKAKQHNFIGRILLEKNMGDSVQSCKLLNL
ncbi:hypothetical protein Hanom_Chr12g01164161 [Helianthus anomalus]